MTTRRQYGGGRRRGASEPEPELPEGVDVGEVGVAEEDTHTLSLLIPRGLYRRLTMAKLETRKTYRRISLEAFELWLTENGF